METAKHIPIECYFDGTYGDGEEQNLVSSPPKLIDHETKVELYGRLSALCDRGVEVTITFKPQLHDAFTPNVLTQMVRQLLQRYRHRYKFSIILIGEYSKKGKYHFHGAMLADGKFTNIIQRRLTREFGRTEIEYIRYSEGWAIYCMKKDDNDRDNQKDISEDEYIWID